MKCYKCSNPRPENDSPEPIHLNIMHALPEQPIEQPEKPEQKVLTERARVEEEMKRWEKEQQKVERLNKQLMTFEVDIAKTLQPSLQKSSDKPKNKFELIPDDVPVTEVPKFKMLTEKDPYAF
jgi:HD superfamily phosphohydrolase